MSVEVVMQPFEEVERVEGPPRLPEGTRDIERGMPDVAMDTPVQSNRPRDK